MFRKCVFKDTQNRAEFPIIMKEGIETALEYNKCKVHDKREIGVLEVMIANPTPMLKRRKDMRYYTLLD